MRKISNNVSVSFGNYRVKDSMLKDLADHLGAFLKVFIPETHLKGMRIDDAQNLPEYTEHYLEYKANFLGVGEFNVTPNLELTGELHNNADYKVMANNIGYDMSYELSPEGFEHMQTTLSENVWETLSAIHPKYWDLDILPFLASIMDTYRGNMLDRDTEEDFTLF